MIRFSRGESEEAQVRFLPSEFHVLVPGKGVRCAVTGTFIPLAELRYWNVERQEAYIDPQTSLKRHQECGDVS